VTITLHFVILSGHSTENYSDEHLSFLLLVGFLRLPSFAWVWSAWLLRIGFALAHMNAAYIWLSYVLRIQSALVTCCPAHGAYLFFTLCTV
jgi:hypothetical protein